MDDEQLESALADLEANSPFDRPDDPDTWNGPNYLIHLHDKSDDYDIGWMPLPGHPSETLLGYVAPFDWDALGTVSYGWAGEVGALPPSLQAGRRRIRVSVLVDRAGNMAFRGRDSQGEPLPDRPSEGLVLECLQRALGVQTAPPPATTDSLFAALWLSAIVEEGERTGDRLGWPAAASLHPAAKLLSAPASSRLTGDAIVDLARSLAQLIPWSEARWLSVSTGWLGDVASPTVAAWMDDGMFARSALHACELRRLCLLADRHLTTRAAGKLRWVLQQLPPALHQAA